MSGVRPGLRVYLDVGTVSGSARSDLDADDVAADDGDETIELRVRTVSGDARIERAGVAAASLAALLDALCGQFLGEERTGVALPGEVAVAEEQTQRLTRAAKARGGRLELSQTGRERRARGRVVEVSRQRADGTPVELELDDADRRPSRAATRRGVGLRSGRPGPT